MPATDLNTRIRKLYDEAARLADRRLLPAANECLAAARRLERQRSRGKRTK